MSHNPSEAIVCPNCGYHATMNYCARCGQETHLHKETFWGMVTHFAAHYFHYDSKFWMTLKALWFRPGKLTIAYWNNQRMRYIPPISLYIFISFIFFFFAFSDGPHKTAAKTTTTFTQRNSAGGVDTLAAIRSGTGFSRLRRAVDSLDNSWDEEVPAAEHQKGQLNSYIQQQTKKIEAKHGNSNAYLAGRLKSNFPKLFFFMIPVLALFMKLLFLRRRDAWFVHHAVFSLHVHSFFFSVFTLTLINPFAVIQSYLNIALVAAYVIYFIAAIRNTYRTGWVRAIFNTVFIGFGYVLFFAFAFVLDFLFIMATV